MQYGIASIKNGFMAQTSVSGIGIPLGRFWTMILLNYGVMNQLRYGSINVDIVAENTRS